MKLKDSSYLKVVLLCTLASGLTGLVFQVIWQKYLSYLLGSESRSISLVVAVFLMGLASGNLFWGNLTAKVKERKNLLKKYGFIEIGIGLYAILFPYLFKLLELMATMVPNHIFFDFIFAFLALFLPTFLMGGTVPLLTGSLPTSGPEVNRAHSQVYGINTLGAFVGVNLGAYYFSPVLGLPYGLMVCGFLNIFIGLIFIFNPLKGEVKKSEEIPFISSKLSNLQVYTFVFMIGMISIALEILLMRIMNLTIGSGFYVFPMVVGTFVLGLAIGSLSLQKSLKTMKDIENSLIFITIYLLILFASIPYWGYWNHKIRITLSFIDWAFDVYLVIVNLLFIFVCLPFLIPMGRLLPMGFMLLKRSGDDYGKLCGRLYFANTLGTAIGSIVLGHMILYILDIDHVLRILIGLICFLAFLSLAREERKFKLAATVALMTVIILIPKWNRDSHKIGLYRMRKPQNFSSMGVFSIPSMKNNYDTIFFEDGPNTTVTVLDASKKYKKKSYSLVVNGKSDSSTHVDYITLHLAALLGPLLHDKSTNLNSAVIGLGTSVTSGALARLDDVSSVTTLEISPFVQKAMEYFSDFNYGLSKNPKSKILTVDAFRYFRREQNKHDIIVSEPSNPWVVGVESLFTPEFYNLVNESLDKEGVFVQWVQRYEFNSTLMSSIVSNLQKVFPTVIQFDLKNMDTLFVAFKNNPKLSQFSRRFNDPFVKNVFKNLGIHTEAEFWMLHSYNDSDLRLLKKAYPPIEHSLEKPRLNFLAGRAFFLEQGVGLKDFKLNRALALLTQNPLKRDQFKRLVAQDKLGCLDYAFSKDSVLCKELVVHKANYNIWKSKDNKEITDEMRLKAYNYLRKEGLIDRDMGFLKEFYDNFRIQNFAHLKDAAQSLFLDGFWVEGRDLIHNNAKNLKLSQDEQDQLNLLLKYYLGDLQDYLRKFSSL